MYLQIKDIKKGDHFWEKCWEFEALEDGYFAGTVTLYDIEQKQWRVKGKKVGTDTVVNFLTTDGSPYGPHLTRMCEYIQVKTLEELKDKPKHMETETNNYTTIEIDLNEFTKDQLMNIIVAANKVNKTFNDFIVDGLTKFCEDIDNLPEI